MMIGDLVREAKKQRENKQVREKRERIVFLRMIAILSVVMLVAAYFLKDTSLSDSVGTVCVVIGGFSAIITVARFIFGD